MIFKRSKSIWRAVYRLNNLASSLLRLKNKKKPQQALNQSKPITRLQEFSRALLGIFRSLRRLRKAKIISSLLTETSLHGLKLSVFFPRWCRSCYTIWTKSSKPIFLYKEGNDGERNERKIYYNLFRRRLWRGVDVSKIFWRSVCRCWFPEIRIIWKVLKQDGSTHTICVILAFLSK